MIIPKSKCEGSSWNTAEVVYCASWVFCSNSALTQGCVSPAMTDLNRAAEAAPDTVWCPRQEHLIPCGAIAERCGAEHPPVASTAGRWHLLHKRVRHPCARYRRLAGAAVSSRDQKCGWSSGSLCLSPCLISLLTECAVVCCRKKLI